MKNHFHYKLGAVERRLAPTLRPRRASMKQSFTYVRRRPIADTMHHSPLPHLVMEVVL